MRARTWIAVGIVAGVLLFIAGALGPLQAGRSIAELRADGRPTGASGSSVINGLRRQIAAAPENPHLHARLAVAYLDLARDAADPSVLPLADEALRRSLELQPEGNADAFQGMAALANARHDFSGSVEWSRRAIEAAPYDASSYGLLGDALFELGQVKRADAAYQRMVDLKPDVASYVRASYSLQYHRRTRAALTVMRLALKAAGPTGETAAWVRHQLGDIYAGSKDTRAAARQNRIGMQVAPGYVPPTVGLAESLIVRGRLAEAIEIMEDAVVQLPTLEYLITLGDLYEATGRDEDADKRYAEVAERLAGYRAAGVLPDADFILFYADHSLRPKAALAEARAIYLDRPTPKTADALAWMLHSVGKERRAWRYAREAIAHPSRDSSMLFHAGMIARSLDERSVARRLLREAIVLDPAFSTVQAPIARRLLRSDP